MIAFRRMSASLFLPISWLALSPRADPAELAKRFAPLVEDGPERTLARPVSNETIAVLNFHIVAVDRHAGKHASAMFGQTMLRLARLRFPVFLPHRPAPPICKIRAAIAKRATRSSVTTKTTACVRSRFRGNVF